MLVIRGGSAVTRTRVGQRAADRDGHRRRSRCRCPAAARPRRRPGRPAGDRGDVRGARAGVGHEVDPGRRRPWSAARPRCCPRSVKKKTSVPSGTNVPAGSIDDRGHHRDARRWRRRTAGWRSGRPSTRRGRSAAPSSQPRIAASERHRDDQPRLRHRHRPPRPRPHGATTSRPGGGRRRAARSRPPTPRVSDSTTSVPDPACRPCEGQRGHRARARGARRPA